VHPQYTSQQRTCDAMSRTVPRTLTEIVYSTFNTQANSIESASQFFDAMMKRFGSNPRLSLEILSEASRNPALRRVLRQNQEEYANGLASFLEGLRKMRLIDDNLELLPLAYSLIALWNGLETLVVSGLPVEEVKGAWLEG